MQDSSVLIGPVIQWIESSASASLFSFMKRKDPWEKRKLHIGETE